MTIQPETTVSAAQYHRDGYITATWTTSVCVALAGFALTIRRVRQGGLEQSTQFVEDGMAWEAGLPYEFVAGARYELVVTPFDGTAFLSPSAPYPIANPLGMAAGDEQPAAGASRPAGSAGLSKAYRLEFVERLPYTPLFIDSGLNVVKVKLLGADGNPLRNQPVRWCVPPAYSGVRLDTTKPTMTNDDGVAVNRVRIDRGAQLPRLLTVSAWYDLPGEPQHHVSTLFECADVRVFCSFVQNFAHPWTSEDEPRQDELITGTVTVLDDQSRPVRGLRMAWRMEPNAASAAYERIDGAWLRRLAWQDWPRYERGFPVVTNHRGQSTILFANYGVQIMGVSPTVNAVEYPSYAVFTAVDLGTGAEPPAGLPLSGPTRVLQLDTFPDSVPVTLPQDIGVSNDGAIWLNDEIVSIVFMGTMRPPATVPVPSEYFVPGETPNRIGYVKSGPNGNGADSVLSKFRVTGTPHIPQPAPGGTLAAPRFEAGGVNIVNDSVVAGGLALRIPAYVSIAAGDEVRLRLYLEGYYQGTGFKKYGFYETTHGVQRSDLADGFVIVVDESVLRGYAASVNGERGSFVAQYAISSSSAAVLGKKHSMLLSKELVTTVPDRPFDWIAFGREP